MNFGHLLNVAEKNRSLSTNVTSVKRYSTEVAPAKKPPKSNVQSDAIRAFLQRKEQEERQKRLEEMQKKEKLLELRAQNTKSNKRAKVMASRTKDNDFSRIRLTEEEEEARRKREMELHRKMLTDKVERMKARIALEQQEEGQPHKRKRRKQGPGGEPVAAEADAERQKPHERKPRKRKYELYTGEEEVGEEEPKKQRPSASRPPPPVVDYHDLLKIARVKQHEPLPLEKPVVEKPKEEWRPLTKQEKEKRMEEELHKKGVKLHSLPPIRKKPSATSSAERKAERTPTLNGSAPPRTLPPSSAKAVPPRPAKPANDVRRFSDPQRSEKTNGIVKQTSSGVGVGQRRELEKQALRQEMLKKRAQISSGMGRDVMMSKKVAAPGPSQIARSSTASLAKEKRREHEEDTYYAYSNRPKSAPPNPKMAQKRELSSGSKPPPSSKSALPSSRPEVKPQRPTSAVPEKRRLPEKPMERPTERPSKSLETEKGTAQKYRISPEELQRRKEMALRMKRKLEERQKREAAPPPPKKSYEEQYEDLYRRLQGTHYIESEEEEEDEEYEDEEDDVDSFIDDGPTSDGLDYSKHIREIFGYDRRKFVDIDDEEALESSYAQQMKEEVRSARIGLKEDIEDMKREEEELKRKQLRKLEAMRKMHRKLR